MIAGQLEIQLMADMSRLVRDMENAKRTTASASAAMESSMGRVTDAIDAIAAAEKARAGIFERTWNETKRLLGVAKSAADDTRKSLAGLEIPQEAIASLRTWQDRAAYAIGAGAAEGWEKAKTAWQEFKDWMERQVVIWGIALAVGISAAVLGAVYAAFKGISFAVGLLTGESYKSANIDALVAMNKEVKTLQENLPLTAVGASALNEALKVQGLSATSYVATLSSVSAAQRANSDELDRLGVKYKDQNGNLLSTRETLVSAAAVLATYKEGWDRTQAAQALGMGSEKQIQDALAVTAEKTQEAKDRLVDYGLVIGEDTQQAVTRYEDAMRAFNRESDLTSQGFKRAIADNIMPALTDLAEFFREGFPFVVRAFRGSIATITSLFYGLKTSVFIVSESIVGSISAIGSVLGGLAEAAGKALTGDFSGAQKSLLSGWEEAKSRLGGIGDNIVEQARRNSAAMALAWGVGSENAASEAAKVGKAWTPKPVDIKAVEDALSAYRNLIKSLTERLAIGGELTEVQKLELAFGAMSEKQLAAITPAMRAYAEELARQLDLKKQLIEVDKAALEYARYLTAEQERQDAVLSNANTTLSEQIQQLEFETSLVKMSAEQKEIATAMRKLDMDFQRAQIGLNEEELVTLKNLYDIQKARLPGAIALKAQAEEQMAIQVSMWKSIEDAARQTFISIFDSGKDTFTRLRDTLKNTLYALLYEMTVKKWIINVAASVGGAGVAQSAFGSTGGVGGSAGSWMNIGSSVKGVYDAVSGGFTAIGDSIAFAAEDAGAWLVQNTTGVLNELGSTMMQSSGAIGMAASYIGAGMAGIAVGTAIAGDKELFGMSGGQMSTIGAIAGGIFGGPIGAAIGGALGGMLSAAFGEGSKQTGTTTLAGNFGAEGFSGAYRTPWSRSGGWFSSGSSGVDVTAVPAAQQQAFSNMIMGTRSVFDRLVSVSGDAARSVDSWTFAIDRQLATEEQQKQLIVDVANSMGAYLIPELVALQAKGENLADTAVRMADEFAITNRLAQLLGQNMATAFGGIGLASLAARDRLVQLMGGMQQMAATTQTYYQNFFTESERHVIDLKAVSDQMATLGLSMPDTREGFRALVEAQDLSTVAGQNMFVALMTISGAFAAVTESADATSKALSDLDKNRFRTLVDYQRAVAYTTAGISTVGIPGFASGGDFMGGLRIVGENGPELESTGPSRITNTNDLMSALRNPQAANAILVEEVRQMRMELATANRQLADIKKNTLNTDRTLTKFDGDGLPPTRV